METEKFQELVLSHLTKLFADVSGLKDDVSGLRSKSDLVYDHVAKITEN